MDTSTATEIDKAKFATELFVEIERLRAANARLANELVLTRSFVPDDQICELEQLCQLEQAIATQEA
jgi:hypothetical protein